MKDINAKKDWRWNYNKKSKEVIHQFLYEINECGNDGFNKLIKENKE